jgi:mRNA deadenylase 3'-5' endonuclease subunit Ccr4
MPQVTLDPIGLQNSAPFEFLSTGKLTTNHPQHPDKWCDQLGEAYNNPRLGDFTNTWKLDNAYYLPEFTAEQPLFTTKTDEFQGWIDHIWCNPHVMVNSVLSPPVRATQSENDGKIFTAIPNINFPSDHLPLGIIASIKR